MYFRTEINSQTIAKTLNPSKQIYLIGSCFSENIGQKLQNQFIKTSINPFGILYNPYSILNCLERVISKTHYTSHELIKNNELYCSFDHHGSFNSNNEEDCLNKINSEIDLAHQELKNSKTLIISLGTSYLYKEKETQRIVANCHRFPAHKFERQLSTFPEILKAYKTLIPKLLSFNKELQIIFTVSPIRHLRDSFTENQVSKAQLLTVCHFLQEDFPQCSYFPSYEIMMDDLRDYRFYEEDMIHPNKVAIDYIWQKFTEFAFSAKDLDYFKDITQIQKRLSHRLRNPESTESKKYIEATLKFVEKMKLKYPDANWEKLSWKHYE